MSELSAGMAPLSQHQPLLTPWSYPEFDLRSEVCLAYRSEDGKVCKIIMRQVSSLLVLS